MSPYSVSAAKLYPSNVFLDIIGAYVNAGCRPADQNLRPPLFTNTRLYSIQCIFSVILCRSESRCYFYCHTPNKCGVRYHSAKSGVPVPPRKLRIWSEQKPIKSLEKSERGRRAYPGTAKFFLDTPNSLRNGWSLKLYGLQIWQVYTRGPSDQSTLKILVKRERGHIQGLPHFWVPPIISESAR